MPSLHLSFRAAECFSQPHHPSLARNTRRSDRGGFWHHHLHLTPTTPPSLETLDRGGGVWPPPPLHCSNARRRVFLASTTPHLLETQDGGPPHQEKYLEPRAS